MKRLLLSVLSVPLLATLATLAGCGPETKPEGEGAATIGVNPSGSDANTISYAIRDLKDAPECKNANQNQLIFVIGEKQFYTCDQAAWVVISLEKEHPEDVEVPSSTDKPNTDPAIAVEVESAGENCPAGGIAIKYGSSTYHACNGKDGTGGQQGGKGDKGDPGTKGDKGDDKIVAMWYCPKNGPFVGGYVARNTIYQEYASGKKFMQTVWEIVGGTGFRTAVCMSTSNPCELQYSDSSGGVYSNFSNGTVRNGTWGSGISEFVGTVTCEKIF